MKSDLTFHLATSASMRARSAVASLRTSSSRCSTCSKAFRWASSRWANSLSSVRFSWAIREHGISKWSNLLTIEDFSNFLVDSQEIIQLCLIRIHSRVSSTICNHMRSIEWCVKSRWKVYRRFGIGRYWLVDWTTQTHIISLLALLWLGGVWLINKIWRRLTSFWIAR